MKNLLISDFHGKDLCDFLEEMLEKIDRVVFLGDYDYPYILQNVLKLSIDKIVLVGNHDFDLCRRKPFFSPSIPMSGFESLATRWDQNHEQKAFVLQERPFKYVQQTTNGKVLYLHGLLEDPNLDPYREFPELSGRVGNLECSDNLRNIESNFRRMEELDYWLMIKGHEHVPIVLSYGRGTITKEFLPENSSGLLGSVNIQLSLEKRYIVGVGSFYLGDYVIFDDEGPSIEFLRI
jgi:predicted phosphodiesterase